MRIYDTPKCLADLEVGDIVYTTINGEITQAKVFAYKKIFYADKSDFRILGKINNTIDKAINSTKSYIKFITPKGQEFIKYFDETNQSQPYIYNTLEDLRTQKKYGYTHLENSYGYRNSNESNTAMLKFVGKLRRSGLFSNAKITDSGKVCLWRHNKLRQKVEEIEFDLIVFDSEKEDIQLGYYYTSGDNCIWGEYKDLINKKRFYTTYEECYQATLPKVITFDNVVPNNEKEQEVEITLKLKFKTSKEQADTLKALSDYIMK